MKKKKPIEPIPPEMQERFERNQQRLRERIAELERRIAARESGDSTSQ